MPDTPEDWHRQIAAATFNRAWELMEKPDRSADEDTEDCWPLPSPPATTGLASVETRSARAHAVAGDAPERDRYIALAKESLERIEDPQ
jgi:hypothetical protein